jgi:MerR family transcriptional regulator/heat shock protein HspR
MKLRQREPIAATAPSAQAGGIDLDKPIFTLSVASEILEVHPRTLMMYEHLSMINPKRTVTNRRRLSREHHVNLAGVRYILALLKRLHNAGIEAPDGLKNLDVSQLDV